MRSMWENVAERVYETDVALGVSRHNTNLIGPEEPGEQRETKKRPTTAVIEEMEMIDREHRDGWKPVTLSTPMLAAVIALTLLIAAAVETLAQRSKSQGALALSASADGIPMYAQLGSLYLPIIAAVIYSMVWSLVDLDAKRMQPWFQLSREKAPTAKNSLFLDYQYEFVGTVPWQSAKRRHWPAFFAGTAMVLVFWVITPFQSTIMGAGTVKQTGLATIGTRSSLVSMDKQRRLLSSADVNTAYAVAWLDQPYPAFTTSTYALLPFYVNDDPSPTNAKSNWTATTTKLWTDLDCKLAELIDTTKSRGFVVGTFSNGQGCNVSAIIRASISNPNPSMEYYGYYYGDEDTNSFGTSDCPATANSTHQFFAKWAGAKKAENNQPANITVMFCQTSYHSQKVLATVDAETLVPDPDSIREVEPQKTLSESEFNSTTFEYVISIGETDLKGWDQPNTDPPGAAAATAWSHLLDRGSRANSSGFYDNMVGFGIAATNLSLQSYSDPKVINSAFKAAHQSLFVVALQSLLTNDTSFTNTTASVEYELHGIIVSRRFSAIVEGFLCLVAVFTGFLLWVCRTSPSKLSMNPSSISRYMDLFRHSPELLDLFRPMDTMSEKKLKKKLGKDEIKMLHDEEDGRTKFLVFQDSSNSQNPESSGNARRPHGSQHSQDSTEQQEPTFKGLYKPRRPLALRRGSGALFIAILIAAIVVLCYFKVKEQSLGGLPRPSNNFEVLQILENYIPTVFATLVEPFWLLLTRLVCVLQPFRDLSDGKAKASSSINATYTSIPPQLVFWRALKSRHFILMLLCSMSMIANILAVGLGSLFTERSARIKHEESIHSTFAPEFLNNTATWEMKSFVYKYWNKDHLYVAWANMSADTTLPPWISQDYFFQMHNLSESSKTGDTYTFQTMGFGANPNCTAVGSFEVPVKAPSLNNRTCYPPIEQAGIDMRSAMFSAGSYGTVSHSSGPLAVEYTSDTAVCSVPLVVGWGRTSNGTDSNSTIEASLVTCHPIMETAMFNLTVDMNGYVISYNRTGDLESPSYAGSKNTTDRLLNYTNRVWFQSPTIGHNDTIARDWMNYFIALRLDSREFLDAQFSVPDSKKMASVIEDIYRRNFAILLGLGYKDLFSDKAGESIQAIRSSSETRIFMEEASFYIAVVILGLNAVAAIIFYARPTGFILPRLPTTLGSLIAYIASSRLASPTYKKIPGRDARTYSFGRFQGVDGKIHVGIEMDPHVVPIDLASLVKKPGVFHRLRQFFTSSPPPSSK